MADENSTLKGRARYKTPEYRSWSSMIRRCTDQKLNKWYLYGGRGIAVCERWRTSYDNFLADLGSRPPGTTLDRYPNNNGDYEPGNCRWATAKQQAENRAPYGSRKPGWQRKTKTKSPKLNIPISAAEAATMGRKLRGSLAKQRLIDDAAR